MRLWQTRQSAIAGKFAFVIVSDSCNDRWHASQGFFVARSRRIFAGGGLRYRPFSMAARIAGAAFPSFPCSAWLNLETNNGVGVSRGVR